MRVRFICTGEEIGYWERNGQAIPRIGESVILDDGVRRRVNDVVHYDTKVLVYLLGIYGDGEAKAGVA